MFFLFHALISVRLFTLVADRDQLSAIADQNSEALFKLRNMAHQQLNREAVDE